MLRPMSDTSAGWGSFSGESDEELVVQALNAPEGDVRAFEKLVLRYQKRVVANCRGITRDPNNCQDLAQEILLKAFFGLRRLETKSLFGRWLQRIKINHCLNYVEKNQGRSFIDIEDAETYEVDELKINVTAERLAVEISNRQAISEVLEAMPTTLRIPLVLCDMDEMSYDEVATMLGIGLSATKMRIKRAREEFRLRYAKAQSISTAAVGGR